MRLPSKLFSYDNSVLSCFPIVLSTLKVKPTPVFELYQLVSNKVENVAEFLEVLDALYLLNKIDLDHKTGALYYVD